MFSDNRYRAIKINVPVILNQSVIRVIRSMNRSQVGPIFRAPGERILFFSDRFPAGNEFWLF
jgi:hypothetical protein